MKKVLFHLALLFCLAFTVGARSAESKRATYDVVVERNVMVEMRDGVRLATDVYYPAKDGKPIDAKLPSLLMRTAYNKERWGPDIVRFFARHGYISVTQDCRGRYQSEGRFFPWVDDPEDGYDTIEWIAELPRSNGRVGMHGPSHMAWVQFHAATQKPPHLVAMAPFQGPINATNNDYNDFWRQPGLGMDEYFDRFPEMPILWSRIPCS